MELLNSLAAANIRFSDVKRRENNISMWLPQGQTDELRSVCPAGAVIRMQDRSCLQRAKAVLHRYRGYLVCGGLLVLLLWFSTFFVWQISVEGCEKSEVSGILRVLERENVRAGMFRFVNFPENLENRILLEEDGISRVGINPKGTVFHVQVRKKTDFPVKTADTPTDICAAADGVIESVTALEGLGAVQPGDAVEKGDVLIASEWASVSSGTRFVSAKGEVTARTLRTVTAKVPVSGEKTGAASQPEDRWSVIFGRKRMNFYFNSGNSGATCDKIRTVYTLALPGGVTVPLCAVREAWNPGLSGAAADAESIETVTKQMLLTRLEAMLPKAGEVVQTTYITERTETVLTVTLTAECLENIAVECPAEAWEDPEEITQ